jgi:hypothetical protein
VARRVFFSFHYKPDSWRAAQIRNMGVVEGNRPVSDNDWETIKRGRTKAIEQWILSQLHGRSCTVVLVGGKTAGRHWIEYEIKHSWNAGKGVVGIHIHKLEDDEGKQSQKGGNPFDLTIGNKKLSSMVKLYDPPQATSTYVYNHIQRNLADWVEEAIEIRNRTTLLFRL